MPGSNYDCSIAGRSTSIFVLGDRRSIRKKCPTDQTISGGRQHALLLFTSPTPTVSQELHSASLTYVRVKQKKHSLEKIMKEFY